MIVAPAAGNVLWDAERHPAHLQMLPTSSVLKCAMFSVLVLLPAWPQHVQSCARRNALSITSTHAAPVERAVLPPLPIGGAIGLDQAPSVDLNASNTDAVPSDWYAQVTKNIAASEYHINWQERVGAFQSPNRQQDLRITYRADGFSLKPRVADSLWSVALALEGIGRQGQWHRPTGEAAITVTDARLRADHGAFAVEYQNAEEGMRQNFIVREKPAGAAPLEVRLRYSGTLRPADKGDNAIAFCQAVQGTDSYQPVLWYKDLHVWDANGDTLEATASLENDAIVLSVLDHGAQYPITVDPLSTTADWSAESDQVTAHFGQSVSSAGDVNGDGYSDVIVGAPDFDNGQTNEGRAYLYHGSATGTAAAPNWTFESDAANAQLGISVATAGDVNGDGYSDAIIGAAGYTNGQSTEGRVYVFRGSGTGLPLTPHWTYESDVSLARLGHSVACAGDVNGDGYSDVIAGAYDLSSGHTNEGRAYVFHGSAGNLPAAPSWTYESNQVSARLGRSVAGAGDVNGDGYSDVIIGVYGWDNGQSNEGRALVFHGSGTGLPAAPNWSEEIDQADAWFGYSVATAGDVNGDGYSDAIIGSWQYNGGLVAEGAAFVYHGGPAGLAAAHAWMREGDQAVAHFGEAVACAGDINGDGFADILVGAPDYDQALVSAGRVQLWLGTESGISGLPYWTSDGTTASGGFGTSVASAGDVNGDGYSDILIGAPGHHGGQAQEGNAAVFFGAAEGLAANAAWTAESDQVGRWFGYSVSSAGDVNGDGYNDAIVAAVIYYNGQTNEGHAFVYHGSGTGLGATAAWTAESDQAIAYFGYSVSSAGDVNGDGYSDVIVGAVYFDNGQTDEGRAFVYHGSPTGLGATAAWTAESDQAQAYFGSSVSSAGDVNGDGYSDVIVGAYWWNNGQTDEGRAFVYHGSPTGLGATAAWTAESDQASAWFGCSVSSAGDVNGDGYGDVIVGAFGYDNGQTNEGRAFVYHGSPMGLGATAAWAAESDQANARFGHSVSSAGDVNGDGYSDAIVGAFIYDNGQTDEGRAFVYHGNNGTGRRHNLRLYNTNLTAPISASNIPVAQFGVGLYAKPFLGRQRTRLVWETRIQGQAFSSAGGRITNSTASTAQQAASTLTAVAGTQLKDLVNKLTSTFPITATKLRARLRYPLATALTGQVFGPWRYMPGYLDGHGTHNNIPLPVEMLWMEAACDRGKPLLTWATATEHNNARFVIERSRDAQAWDAVGEIAGAGNSQQVLEYAWVDEAPINGALAYYRLRQVDLDGHEEVLAVLPLEPCGAAGAILSVLPNPTDGPVEVRWNAQEEASGIRDLRVLDAQGRVLHGARVGAQAMRAHLDLSALAAGTYTLIATDAAGRQVGTARLVRW